ncbi:hypothetical protein [Brevundimonas sp. A19_0]|uniref:hypothetical protein n=1 Tax=Brevundimonas sp. A19_0 TaxID=2821087 RepID=UPI001ADAB45C|nr:hypothetical protein [Brevundimonas sp. A19_0]MBO9500784.1 hypothetical protein [Brevundimonas sp. A19_0]
MEYFGLLLFLAAPLAGIVALWALFRPITALGLTTKRRAAVALASSAFAFLLGLVLIAANVPPVDAPVSQESTESASASPPKQNSPPARKQSAPAPRPMVPALDMTRDQLLQDMNKFWREADQPGAFSVADADPVRAGPNQGGSIARACVNEANCLVVETRPDGRVVSATIITMTDGSGRGTSQSMLTSLGLLVVFGEGNPESGREFQRQLQRLVAGDENQEARVGSVCLVLSGGGPIGLWTTVSAPPCGD